MIINFRVSNFLSFPPAAGNIQNAFALHTNKNASTPLKYVNVQGRNGMGKSNLVKAIEFFQRTVLNRGLEESEWKYNKHNSNNECKPSFFEMEILLGGRHYRYGFSVILMRKKFIREWLFELDGNDGEVMLFERDTTNEQYKFGGCMSEEGLADQLIADIRGRCGALFLTTIVLKETLYEGREFIEIFNDIFSWVRDGLRIMRPNETVVEYDCMDGESRLSEFCNKLSVLDTGISGFALEDSMFDWVNYRLFDDEKDKVISKLEREKMRVYKGESRGATWAVRTPYDMFLICVDESGEATCQIVLFEHGNMLLNLEEESTGTVWLIDLLEILLSDKSRTYVIDDFGQSLHPVLVQYLLNEIDERSKERDVQVIFTAREGN